MKILKKIARKMGIGFAKTKVFAEDKMGEVKSSESFKKVKKEAKSFSKDIKSSFEQELKQTKKKPGMVKKKVVKKKVMPKKKVVKKSKK